MKAKDHGMIEVTIQSASGGRETFLLDGEVTRIGRSADNEISLPDQWLSRRHAEIRVEENAYHLIDLGSRNGTRLNGKPLQGKTQLHPGDRIGLGDYVVIFSPEAVEEVGGGHAPHETWTMSARRFSEDMDTQPSFDAEELNRQRRTLGILTRTASALLVHRPLQELLEFVLDQLFDAVFPDRGAILLLEGDPPELVPRASRSRSGPKISKVSHSITQRVIEQEMSILLKKVMDDAELRSRDSILSQSVRSAICAPLWFTAESQDRDKVIGLVYLDMVHDSRFFDEEDLRILTALANVAASKIENERLLVESLQMRRMEQDLRLAARIQDDLLPDAAPAVPGYEVAASTTPCLAVGGDYYDFALDDDDLLLTLGDVSGKGTSAALLTTVLRASVRAHWCGSDVAGAVARINQTVHDNVPEGRYVTFFLARLEPATGHLRYVNAGHNPPLLVRETGSIETLEQGGMVLGPFQTAEYTLGTAELRPGDSLVIFSDGVTEGCDAEMREFGEQRLGEVVRQARSLDAEGLRARVLSELNAYEGDAKATDDRTLVVLKRS
jgi:sigma-B regulation protein RsbU (phosphoserine phosphatase)